MNLAMRNETQKLSPRGGHTVHTKKPTLTQTKGMGALYNASHDIDKPSQTICQRLTPNSDHHQCSFYDNVV